MELCFSRGGVELWLYSWLCVYAREGVELRLYSRLCVCAREGVELELYSWNSVFVPEKGWNSGYIHSSVRKRGGNLVHIVILA